MKNLIRKYIGDLFFTRRFYAAFAFVAVLFFMRFFLYWLGMIPFVCLGTCLLLVILDYVFLFFNRSGLWAGRTHAERFSNGDENPVRIDVKSYYNFPVSIEIVDEIPHQFQRRDVLFKVSIPALASRFIEYTLRPVKRGVYSFGGLHLYAKGPLAMVMRRFSFELPADLPVYPSYLQMRKYQLMAIHNRLNEAGIRKLRRIGHSMEFEQIKEYVGGDDYRTVNWKATARKGQLMVNHYSDEKSQQVYCVIDKSRVMKMPFEGLSLLDYAINASLVLSNIALLKQDRAGLISFAESIGTVIKADKKLTQMQLILEALYHQKTRYLESDYERLYAQIRSGISQRSLIVLFTNFESMAALNRQLPYLRKIAGRHLLLVVFFENTEISQLAAKKADDIESVYKRTIAEKFLFEKKMIVKELQKYGILSILTPPQQVTVNTINKYLELKARQAI